MIKHLSFLLLVCANAPAAGAQVDSAHALVEGRVRDLSTLPLKDVEILWSQDSRSVLSKSDGSFSLLLPTRGQTVVLFRRPGFRPVALRLDLRSGAWRGTVVMSPGPQQLPDVTVAARLPKPGRYSATTKYDGVFLRQKVGLGAFLSREDIDKSNAMHTLELLQRVPGVHVDPGVPGDPTTADIRMPQCTSEGRRLGKVTVWIDGQRQIEPMTQSGGHYGAEANKLAEILLRISPGDIEMIEVYRSPSQIPGEFHWDGCAAIVIWTRYNPEPDPEKPPSRDGSP
jgi:hypothetical protein